MQKRCASGTTVQKRGAYRQRSGKRLTVLMLHRTVHAELAFRDRGSEESLRRSAVDTGALLASAGTEPGEWSF